MKRGWAVVVASVLVIGAALFALGWDLGARSTDAERAQLRRRVTELSRERDQALRRQGSSLSQALASAFSHRPSPKPIEPKAGSGSPAPASTTAAPTGPFDPFALAEKLSTRQSDAREKLARDLGLTADESDALQKVIDVMNGRVADAFGALVSELQEPHPSSRTLAPTAIELLTAIRNANDGLRQALAPDEQARLDSEDFEIASQIDPMLLLGKLPPNALLALSHSTAGAGPDDE